MDTTFLANDPQAVVRLDSVACIFEWTKSMSAPIRKQFLGALIECSDDAQQLFVSQLKLVKNPRTTPAERNGALRSIAEALSLDLPKEDVRKSNLHEEMFADRLKGLMAAKQISQQELAERMGCSQPAVSQMLNRACRPRKQTIFKLADALHLDPRELWPDIEVADMLDAVADFQQDDYTMTAAEAEALSGTAKKNRPKVRAKLLPTRP